MEYPTCVDPRLLAKRLRKSLAGMKTRALLMGMHRVFSANNGRTKATLKHDRFLQKNYLTMPLKTMASRLKISDQLCKNRLRQLGLVQPPEAIAKFVADSRIKKGSVPMNKGRKQVDYMSAEMIERTKATRFKKGNLPGNTLYDGAIRIRADHANRGGKDYQWIRIGQGKWQQLHRYLWEQKYGPIPPKRILSFKDGNTLNCNLSNLQLLTHRQHMLRNTIQRYPGEVKTAIRRVAKLNKIIKSHGKKQTQ